MTCLATAASNGNQAATGDSGKSPTPCNEAPGLSTSYFSSGELSGPVLGCPGNDAAVEVTASLTHFPAQFCPLCSSREHAVLVRALLHAVVPLGMWRRHWLRADRKSFLPLLDMPYDISAGCYAPAGRLRIEPSTL